MITSASPLAHSILPLEVGSIKMRGDPAVTFDDITNFDGLHLGHGLSSQERSQDASKLPQRPDRDSVNLFMACAAFNFRKFIRILYFLCLKLLGTFFDQMFGPVMPVPDVAF